MSRATGTVRSARRVGVGVALAVVLAAGTLTAMAPPLKAAAAGTLTTFAGGAGFGPATNVAQAPVAVAVAGNRVFTIDGMSPATGVPAIGATYPSVVRALDVSTGVQAVVAGSDVGGYSGDGRPAVGAALSNGRSVIADAQGNVYISDTGTHRIRRVSPTGIISTVAGTGTPGLSGDGGPATSAQLHGPGALAFAADGAIVFADMYNHRIRRIGPNGVISTIAGGGAEAAGAEGGRAVDVQLNGPRAVTFDSAANLYVVEVPGERIRRVTPAGIITTFARIGSVVGIAVVADGRVLVSQGNTVRLLDSSGTSTVIAGSGAGGFSGDGGRATAAELNGPGGVAIDATGNVYFADVQNLRVRMIDRDGVIRTVAGNGSLVYGGDGGQAAAARLWWPGLVRTGLHGTYIVDRGNGRVRHVDPSGTIRTVRESRPQGMAVDRSGNLYISEETRVLKRAPDGTVTVMVDDGAPEGFNPGPLAVDGGGNLYVADRRGDHSLIRRIDPSGVMSTLAGAPPSESEPDYPAPALHAPIPEPDDIAVGADGALYILIRNRILRVSCGVLTAIPMEGIDWDSHPGHGPQGLAIDRAGNIFVAVAGRVHRVAPDGRVTTVAGGGTAPIDEGQRAADAELGRPTGSIALDDAGNLYVVNADRVLRVTGVSAGAAVPATVCTTSPDPLTWPPPVPPEGRYVSLPPARLLDTRSGIGGFASPVGPGGTIAVGVTGGGGVPASGVSAVVLNLTVTQPTAAGHLNVFPSGTTRPTTSSVNFAANETVANLVVAKVGAGGRVSIFNASGSTHVVADVVGWYGAAGSLYSTTLAPSRILDTRYTVGGYSGPVGPNGTIALDVTGSGSVPPSQVDAVVLNVTVTEPSAEGFLSVFPSDTPRPNTSSVNFLPRQTVANLVVSKVGADGKVNILNAAGRTHVIVDVVGWYGPYGSTYDTLAPARLLDTRSGTGGFLAPVGPGGTLALSVTGVGAVPAVGVSAVVLNVTVTQPTAAGHLNVFPSGTPRPPTSSVNFAPNETVANLVVADIGDDGKVNIFNAAGLTHVVIDVVGWYGPRPWVSRP